MIRFWLLLGRKGSAFTLLLFAGAGFGSPGSAHSAGKVHDVCARPVDHGRFVVTSLQQVRDGADRGQVLDVLLCIATNGSTEDGFGTLVGPMAVRAIFHIAEDDERIRTHLLRVIANPTTTSYVHSAACRVLVYVANKEVRKALLDQLKERWPGPMSDHLFGALFTLGDREFLAWLEQVAAPMSEDNRLRSFIERQARYVRMQQNVKELLEHLQGDEEDLDRGWIVRQAVRHGASREAVRRAAVLYLSNVDKSPPLFDDHTLTKFVQECDGYGLFTSDDVAEFPTIRGARRVINTIPREGTSPSWATLPATKRDAFFRRPPEHSER